MFRRQRSLGSRRSRPSFHPEAIASAWTLGRWVWKRLHLSERYGRGRCCFCCWHRGILAVTVIAPSSLSASVRTHLSERYRWCRRILAVIVSSSTTLSAAVLGQNISRHIAAAAAAAPSTDGRSLGTDARTPGGVESRHGRIRIGIRPTFCCRRRPQTPERLAVVRIVVVIVAVAGAARRRIPPRRRRYIALTLPDLGPPT